METPVIQTPQGKPRTSRSGSFLTPNMVENLKKDHKRFIAKGGQVNTFQENVPKRGLTMLKGKSFNNSQMINLKMVLLGDNDK